MNSARIVLPDESARISGTVFRMAIATTISEGRTPQVKGSTRPVKLYEIYGHQPPEVRRFKDDTRDLLEKAFTIYFRKGFKDASRLFRAMLERVPPHRLLPGKLMDSIIPYCIAHCDSWINDRTGAWEKIEKWEGVHIFYEK
jgi:hypothetical protein